MSACSVRNDGWGAGTMYRAPTLAVRGTEEKRDFIAQKAAERFLATQADHFAGAKWKEKTSACCVRNDGWGGGHDVSCPYTSSGLRERLESGAEVLPLGI